MKFERNGCLFLEAIFKLPCDFNPSVANDFDYHYCFDSLSTQKRVFFFLSLSALNTLATIPQLPFWNAYICHASSKTLNYGAGCYVI